MSDYWTMPDGVRRCSVCREAQGEKHYESCLVGLREEIARLRAELEKLEFYKRDYANTVAVHQQLLDRAERAERQRDEFAAALAEAQNWFTPEQTRFGNPPSAHIAKAILSTRYAEQRIKGAVWALRALAEDYSADHFSSDLEDAVSDFIDRIKRREVEVPA